MCESIVELQSSEEFRNTDDAGRAELVRLAMFKAALNKALDVMFDGESMFGYELLTKEQLVKIATDEVDSVNELFPVPFDESVAFVAECLSKALLVFDRSSSSNKERDAVLLCLIRGTGAPVSGS